MTFKWKKYSVVSFSMLFSPIQKTPSIKTTFIRTLKQWIGLTSDWPHLGASTLTCGSRSPISAQPGAISPSLSYAVGVQSPALFLPLPPGWTWALCSRLTVSCRDFGTHSVALSPACLLLLMTGLPRRIQDLIPCMMLSFGLLMDLVTRTSVCLLCCTDPLLPFWKLLLYKL